ncbi:hypothetical protein [Anaerosporobacter faecicola]|uniref:hypothetical protein n=1 Tax=Anaerosporobacter faecicola TaxID=2718714 RepID=UPI0014395134|nr:hypothetical protein [Anaerosporobacter faecicola]
MRITKKIVFFSFLATSVLIICSVLIKHNTCLQQSDPPSSAPAANNLINDFIGEWHRTDTTMGTAADIIIENQTANSFDFTFNGSFGGNTGTIDGTATITESNCAIFESTTEIDNEESAIVQFILDQNCLNVTLISGSNSSLLLGNHVYMDGEYTKSEPVYTNANIIHEILPTKEIQEKLKTLLGQENYDEVLTVIQYGVSYEDTSLNYSGFLSGCGQGVDLLMNDDYIYCLTYFIGDAGYVLFTNDKNYKDCLPSFFEISRDDYKLSFVYKP